MKKQIKTIEQLKDSRIMFDKKPPEFGYLFIVFVGVFLMAAIIFAIRTPKIYTIKSQGIITNTESNYVMCSYTGEIEECNLTEGELVKKGDILFKVKSTDYNLQKEQLIKNRETYKLQVEKYEMLVKSIKDDKNYFDTFSSEDELYYSTFEKYKSQIEQNKVDVSTYKAYGYTDEQIEGELVKNESKVMEVYYTAIQSAENSRNEANIQIASIDAQISALESGKSAYEVKATATGILHLVQEYKSGMVVQPTTTVATITPENSEKILETYVSTSDMARIHKGDKVQVVIDGLAQNVYGNISGKILFIDSNVTVQQSDNGNSFQMFKVKISLDNDYLVSRSGEKVNILNGMTAQARISYDKITYMNYIFEKLGFKTK